MSIEVSLIDEIKSVNAARVSVYQLLSSLFYSELTSEEIEHLKHSELSPEAFDNEAMAQGVALISGYLKTAGVRARQQLAVDYAHTFLSAGSYEVRMAIPYESVYTSPEHLLMQDARDEVLAAYRRWGCCLAEELHEPEDHISFELAFVGQLIAEISDALDAHDSERCQKLSEEIESFITNHLMRWMDEFCADIAKHAQTDFYRGVGLFLSGFVNDDLKTQREISQALTESLPLVDQDMVFA